MSHTYLSVIVPCYNERENLLRGVLEELDAYLNRQTYTYEVLISDDGSTDDSRELIQQRIADKPAYRLLANPHGGKPSAVWYGVQAAQGEIVLFTDMDQSTPITQLDLLLPLFAQGCQVAIGSRGLERANFPLYRRLGSALFGSFRRLFLLRHISDTQCGFKAMQRPVALELFPQLDAIVNVRRVTGWKVTAFDVELLYLAERAGYRIGEVVVTWSNRDAALGKGKSYWRESREMAEQILRLLRNELCGLYRSRARRKSRARDRSASE